MIERRRRVERTACAPAFHTDMSEDEQAQVLAAMKTFSVVTIG